LAGVRTGGRSAKSSPARRHLIIETARDENVLRIYIVCAAETNGEIRKPHLENGTAIG